MKMSSGRASILKPLLEPLLFFSLSVFCYGSALLAFWPGLISDDGVEYIKTFRKISFPNYLRASESAIYGIYSYLSLCVRDDFIFSSMFQVLFAAFVVAYAFHAFRKSQISTWWLRGSLLALVFSPLNALTLIFSEREIFFSWIVAFTLLQVWEISRIELNIPLSRWRIAAVSILFALLPLFRETGALIDLVFLGILGWSQRRRLRITLLPILCASIPMFFVFNLDTLNIYFPGIPSLRPRDPHCFELFLNPLHYLLAHSKIGLSPEDAAFFSTVSTLDVDQLRKDTSAGRYTLVKDARVNIVFRHEPSVKEITGLRSLFLRTALKNPGLFLKIRLEYFLEALTGKIYFEEYNLISSPRREAGPAQLGIWSRPQWRLAHDSWERFFSYLAYHDDLFVFLFSPAFGVICVLALLALSPWLPTTGMFALVFGADLFTVFFFQPLPKARYLFLSQLAPPFLFPILLLELSGRFFALKKFCFPRKSQI